MQCISIADLLGDLLDRHAIGGEQQLGRDLHPEPDQILVGRRVEMLSAKPDEVAFGEPAGGGHVADRDHGIG